MAWGVGTSLMSRAMDSVLGPRQMEVVHKNDDASDGSGGGGSDSNYSGAEESDGGSWFGDEGGWFSDE